MKIFQTANASYCVAGEFKFLRLAMKWDVRG
jgi:hypothetical protein